MNLYLGGIQLLSDAKFSKVKGSVAIPFSSVTTGPAGSSNFENHQSVGLEIVSDKISKELKEIWNQATLVVDTKSTWCLKKLNPSAERTLGFRYLMMPSPAIYPELDMCLLLASQNFEKLKIIKGAWDNQNPKTWMFYPYEQNVFIHLLQFSKNAALCHASGVEIDGKGYLFVGDSGAGKSTISTLLEKGLGPGRIFSDDRMVIRRIESRWYMYGTPWHGDFARIKNSALPIGGLFFLDKTPQHQLVCPSPEDKFRSLLAVIFGTWWLPERIDDHFNFISSLMDQSQFPLLRLGFSPTESITDFIIESIADKFTNARPEADRLLLDA